MKKIVLLFAFAAAVALCAGAQTYIDFHQMPLVKTPTLMPDYYPDGTNLYWDHFFYVTPGLWIGAGPGFWVDPAVQHNTTVFVGGRFCDAAATCVGVIKMPQNRSVPSTFTPVSIQMSAGWVPNKVTITGYNKGTFVGSTTIKLTTKPQIFILPVAWKPVTELVFAPEPVLTNTLRPENAGSVVLYSVVLTTH